MKLLRRLLALSALSFVLAATLAGAVTTATGTGASAVLKKAGNLPYDCVTPGGVFCHGELDIVDGQHCVKTYSCSRADAAQCGFPLCDTLSVVSANASAASNLN